MKKLFIILSLLMALPLVALQSYAAVPEYDAAAAKANAQADFANWMKYLPDDVFVAHVSIPGTHDTATGHGFAYKGTVLGGATYSQTQAVSIEDQLAGGVRAFDFRPGIHDNKLWCNHGIDGTNYTMEDAFKLLTDYLDLHPGEFFVIHFFRGNVYRAGEGSNSNGQFNTQESRDQYNTLVDEFFNKGRLNDYIVDYNPRLKVKDIRGKMVLFRRDRIDFAHFAKAGNFGEWPGESDVWTENGDRSTTQVQHASDPTIKGNVRVSDMSSPDNADEIEGKKTAVRNLYEWFSQQPNPNEKKTTEGFYKPDWAMTFTSGEYQGVSSSIGYKGGRRGYAYCAQELNPYYTDMILNSEKKGPCGILFSDWVLTDSYTHDNAGYSQSFTFRKDGQDLVAAVAYNNFDYIQNYILDDELFPNNETIVENIWEDGKQYFMRNVGTGNFLSAGLWWGTRAVTAAHGIKIIPMLDSGNGKYTLKTTLGANGGFGTNYYLDNGDSHQEFDVKHVGNGKFVFTHKEGDIDKALGITDLWNDNVKFDGATHNVNPVDVNESDPYQQWELISVEDYKTQQLRSARRDKGSDVTFLIPGARFFGNDTENESWNVENNGHVLNWGDVGDEDCRRCLMFWSNTTNNANWKLSQTVTGLPNGIYTIKWLAYMGTGHNDVEFTVNGTSFKGKIKNGTVGVTRSRPNIFTAYSYTISDPKKLREEMRSITDGKLTYECSLENIKITDGQITISASDGSHSTYEKSLFVLDDFELIYYGPDPEEACNFLQKVVDEATAKVNNLPEDIKAGWENDIAKYRNIITTKDIIGDGTTESNEVYTLMRAYTAKNKTEGADFTGMIANNSFELGTDFGWNIIPSNDTKVWENTNSTYHVENCDGDYLFNTWPVGTPLTQTIYGLPAGHYRLDALAVSGDTTDPRYVYLLGGNAKSDRLQINIDKTNFSELSFEFDIAEGEEAVIGIVGANADGTYNEFGGEWYKADNFRLTYLGEPVMDSFYDFLQKAIDMATARVNMIPEEYRTGWDEEMTPYKSIIENRTLEGDGTKEASEIYALMRTHVYSQNFANADFTPAIINNSFEWGNTYGWTVTNPINDTGVKPNSDPTYAVSNCDGDYLFNTWDGDDFGSPITQVMPNLPAGTYRLEALVTSFKDNRVWITANSSRNMIQIPTDKTFFNNIELEFTIDEAQDVKIGAVGGTGIGTYWSADGGKWYKADNFRLTLVEPFKTEKTVEWTMEGDVYDTLILPFDAEIPEGLEIYTADGFDSNITNNEYHVMVLIPENRIMANMPYVVKKTQTKAEPSVRSLSSRAAGIYSFTGVPDETESDYKNGILTGTLTGTNATKGHYVLKHGSDGSLFSRIENETEIPVAANHAYIADEANAINGTIRFEKPEGNVQTGVSEIMTDDTIVDVYTVTGIIIRHNVKKSEALTGLEKGVYMITDGKKTAITIK